MYTYCIYIYVCPYVYSYLHNVYIYVHIIHKVQLYSSSTFLFKYVDSASFYGTLVKKVHSLLLEQEEKEKEIDCENWALREALKSDSLQEGGTFQNTLNKRINYILTKHFFTIVEYVDRHCNLDLLNNSETREIWLVIFSNDNLCHFNSSSDDFNESPEDLLFNHAPRSLALKCCQFPFSWIFLSSLETQWITMELATTSSEITPGNVKNLTCSICLIVCFTFNR